MSTRIRDNQNVTRWLVVLGCALALIAVNAAQAQAADQSTVTLEPNGDGPTTKTLHYEALQSRTNEVTAQLIGSNYVITDTNVNNSTSAGGCTWNSAAQTWTCPAADVTKIVINVGGSTDDVNACGYTSNGDPYEPTIPAGPVCTFGIGIDVIIDGGSGRDQLIGAGSGDSSVAHATSTLIGGPGADWLIAPNGGRTFVSYDEDWRTKAVDVRLPYIFGGVAELDAMSGNGEKNENDYLAGPMQGIIGGPGDDHLQGNLFNNTIVGGPGSDTIVGLKGTDTASYADHSGDVNVHADLPVTELPFSSIRPPVSFCPSGTAALCNPTPDGSPGENDNVGDDVENIVGGQGNDTLVGSSRSDSWSGTLDGGPGNDTLDGGPGPDVL